MSMTKLKRRTFKRHHDIGDITIVLNYVTGTVALSDMSSEFPLMVTGFHTFRDYAKYLDEQGYEEIKT
ncbi:hypothetical protein [Paenilisteria rocourtiae]|uniref:Uncharacterized protein n=1 Tax=Listeria rocourtiae TaxID=647910 RepID=A0A4R6ZMJ1_9LIST|nr:hypothetical protein [Listeria rocourtiae]TDR53691.1 hypothetical protein DFP96_104285 [Listeria rocourtiae]